MAMVEDSDRVLRKRVSPLLKRVKAAVGSDSEDEDQRVSTRRKGKGKERARSSHKRSVDGDSSTSQRETRSHRLSHFNTRPKKRPSPSDSQDSSAMQCSHDMVTSTTGNSSGIQTRSHRHVSHPRPKKRPSNNLPDRFPVTNPSAIAESTSGSSIAGLDPPIRSRQVGVPHSRSRKRPSNDLPDPAPLYPYVTNPTMIAGSSTDSQAPLSSSFTGSQVESFAAGSTHTSLSSPPPSQSSSRNVHFASPVHTIASPTPTRSRSVHFASPLHSTSMYVVSDSPIVISSDSSIQDSPPIDSYPHRFPETPLSVLPRSHSFTFSNLSNLQARHNHNFRHILQLGNSLQTQFGLSNLSRRQSPEELLRTHEQEDRNNGTASHDAAATAQSEFPRISSFSASFSIPRNSSRSDQAQAFHPNERTHLLPPRQDHTHAPSQSHIHPPAMFDQSPRTLLDFTESEESTDSVRNVDSREVIVLSSSDDDDDEAQAQVFVDASHGDQVSSDEDYARRLQSQYNQEYATAQRVPELPRHLPPSYFQSTSSSSSSSRLSDPLLASIIRRHHVVPPSRSRSRLAIEFGIWPVMLYNTILGGHLDYETLLDLEDRLGPAMPRGLSKEARDSLPMRKFCSSSSSTSDNNCVVCMSNFADEEKVTTLPCSHDFHSDCIDPWLCNHRTCPICRSVIPDEA